MLHCIKSLPWKWNHIRIADQYSGGIFTLFSYKEMTKSCLFPAFKQMTYNLHIPWLMPNIFSSFYNQPEQSACGYLPHEGRRGGETFVLLVAVLAPISIKATPLAVRIVVVRRRVDGACWLFPSIPSVLFLRYKSKWPWPDRINVCEQDIVFDGDIWSSRPLSPNLSLSHPCFSLSLSLSFSSMLSLCLSLHICLHLCLSVSLCLPLTFPVPLFVLSVCPSLSPSKIFKVLSYFSFSWELIDSISQTNILLGRNPVLFDLFLVWADVDEKDLIQKRIFCFVFVFCFYTWLDSSYCGGFERRQL